LVQSSNFSGKDCLKTHRRQERFQLQLTILFIAESVALCGLKIPVFFAGFQLLPTMPDVLALSPFYAISFAADSGLLCWCGVLEQASDRYLVESENAELRIIRSWAEGKGSFSNRFRNTGATAERAASRVRKATIL
jgi:hypothetical protein